jgi:DNA-directed RNA polymerase subunit RPC12/RpoP
MNHSTNKTQCPYCNLETVIDLSLNYAPIYNRCTLCSKKFIVERRANGLKIMTLEEAPCDSNPDCRELEMGSSDEQ